MFRKFHIPLVHLLDNKFFRNELYFVLEMSSSCQRETVVENLSSVDSMNRPMVHQQSLADHLPVRLVVIYSKR
jgi:hypothetical protein